MMKHQLPKFLSFASLIKSLERIRLNYGAEFTNKRMQILRACHKRPLRISAALVQRYHEALLLLVAYPDNLAVHRVAESELRRLGRFVHSQIKDSHFLQVLSDSGIEGVVQSSSFSHDAWFWLVSRAGAQLSLHCKDGSLGEEFDDLLYSVLLHAAGDSALNSGLTAEELLRLLGGESGSGPHWLVRALGQVQAVPSVVDQLFSSLDIWMSWRLQGKLGSRTSLRFPIHSVFTHPKSLKSEMSTAKVAAQKLPAPVKLSLRQRQNIVDVTQGTLLVRNRETDPVTYANLEDVHLFQLERGVQVALFGLLPERRLPIESYVGFVVAKNSVPLAYGGAWVLGPRAEIGVNIFDTFRGADSSFIFASILRVYHNFLGVQRFLVQPYQFGEGNKEAIESGAFWFYYRLGFRPVDKKLGHLADEEAKKIRERPGYRSSSHILRRLTGSKIALDLTRNPQGKIEDLDVSEIGLAIADYVGKKFNGDIRAAEQFCSALASRSIGRFWLSGLSPKAREGAERLSLLLPLVYSKRATTPSERKFLGKIFGAKWGPCEMDYIRAIQSQVWFVNILAELAAQGRKVARRFS